MSSVPKTRFTAAEYLARERAANYKSEFFGGEIFAMAGASPRHNAIAANLLGVLYGALAGKDCPAFGSDQRVKVAASGLYTYPDISIFCGPREFDEAEGDTLLNPIAIIEVLSDSTESYDRGKKFDHYRRVESLVEYILVSQHAPQVERFARRSDGDWLLTIAHGLKSEFELSATGSRIELANIYRHVTFESNTSG